MYVMTIVPTLYIGRHTRTNYFYYFYSMHKVIMQFLLHPRYKKTQKDWFSYHEVCISQIFHNVMKTMHFKIRGQHSVYHIT